MGLTARHRGTLEQKGIGARVIAMKYPGVGSRSLARGFQREVSLKALKYPFLTPIIDLADARPRSFLEISPKGQIRREAGAQSHGAHGVSRVAEGKGD